MRGQVAAETARSITARGSAPSLQMPPGVASLQLASEAAFVKALSQ